MRAPLLAACLTLSAALPLASQRAAQRPAAPKDSTPAAQAKPAGAPVVYGNDTLFVIETRLGPFSPAQRARAVVQRLQQITGNLSGRHDSVTVSVGETSTDLLVADSVVTVVTDADAEAAGTSRADLSAERAAALARVLASRSWWEIAKAVSLGLLFSLLATAALALVLWLLNRAVRMMRAKIHSWRGSAIPALRIQRLELLSASRITDALLGALRIVQVAVIIALLFYYVPLVFSFFPWTRNFASTLFTYILTPLKQAGSAFVGYIPNLFYIAVIVLVVRYLLKAVHFFFDGIAREVLRFPDFYAEWAEPTYKIVRFLVLMFALVLIFPYLPGANSDAFKGVSVFVGVLFSFGSAGAIGNIIAGVVITYMRPFKLGDRVRIADTTGDVMERTLLVTRVRTIKNEEITIPNSIVLASHIINYSATAAAEGVILHTAVTIGYDAPWKRIHELLLAAADRTAGLLKEPKPFVLQTALDDFYVRYEINAYTKMPNRMAVIYSDLHQNILDRFNEAGVQIMSPHYLADPAKKKIPEEYARG